MTTLHRWRCVYTWTEMEQGSGQKIAMAIKDWVYASRQSIETDPTIINSIAVGVKDNDEWEVTLPRRVERELNAPSYSRALGKFLLEGALPDDIYLEHILIEHLADLELP